MSPIFKKKDKTFVKNHRPVSVPPTVCKISERTMQKQISDYIGQFISLFLCGYRKGFSTQYVLLTLIERLNFCLDKQGFAGALLTDLSKAMTHSLLNYTRVAFLLMRSKSCESNDLKLRGITLDNNLRFD